MTTDFARALSSDNDEVESAGGVRDAEYTEIIEQDEPVDENSSEQIQDDSVQEQQGNRIKL
ncbi:MAG: hypothetical protein LBR46_08600 [Prevotella sp.]|jgi:hypothetical protein|nr:hypothetical protein [Prevotella sp.]